MSRTCYFTLKPLTTMLSIIITLCIPHSGLFPTEPNQKLTIGMWSNFGARCGIATYSHDIAKNLTKIGHNVVQFKRTMPVDDIIASLDEQPVDVMYLQYIWLWVEKKENRQRLISLLEMLKKRNIPVAFTVHVEHGNDDLEILDSADAVLMHTKPLVLKNLSTVHTIPFPITPYNPTMSKEALRKKYGYQTDDSIISANGFLDDRKKIPEILQSLIPYLKRSRKLKVQLLNVTRDALSRGNAARVNSIIKGHKLEKQVTLITNFLPQEEISDRLYMSDVGFGWNDTKKVSGSSSEQQFVAARLPAVLNNNIRFSFPKGTFKSPNDFGQLAKKVVSLAQDKKELQQAQQSLQEVYQKRTLDVLIYHYDAIFKKIAAKRTNTLSVNQHAAYLNGLDAYNHQELARLFFSDKKLMPKKPTATFMCADMKYDGTNLKILELNPGVVSGTLGYDRLEDFGSTWKELWQQLPKLGLPLFLVAPQTRLNDAALTRFTHLGYKHSIGFKELEHYLSVTPKHKSGILINRYQADKYANRFANQQAFLEKFPNMIALDEVSRPYLNKFFADLLFSGAQLEHYKPVAKTYNRKETAKMLQTKIAHDFANHKSLVIKPLDGFCGNGIIICHPTALPTVLAQVTLAQKSEQALDQTVIKEYEQEITYWQEHKEPRFIVEEFCSSRPLTYARRPYDGTMRAWFMITSSHNTIDCHIWGLFWKLGAKALDDPKARMSERYKSCVLKAESNPPPLPVTPEDRRHVTEILQNILPQLYQKMLSIYVETDQK